MRNDLPVTKDRWTILGMDLNDMVRIQLVFVVIVHNIDHRMDVVSTYPRNEFVVHDDLYRRLYYTENSRRERS